MTDLMLPSRRNVVRTAAWTVPVVATTIAVPAYAASCASTTYDWRLDWGATGTVYTRSNTIVNGVQTGTAVITGPAGTSPLSVYFSSVMSGTMQRDADNLRLSSALTQTTALNNVGGTGGPGLNVSHADPIPSGSGNAQELSISFSRAVTGLKFTITDIDISSGDWNDRVELTGTRTGTGPNIAGSGVPGDPWRASATGNAGNGSNARNLAIEFTGPAVAANTPIAVKFYNSAGNGNQRIFLSDFTFTATGC